jgi:hypothetical protein
LGECIVVIISLVLSSTLRISRCMLLRFLTEAALHDSCIVLGVMLPNLDSSDCVLTINASLPSPGPQLLLFLLHHVSCCSLR